MVVNIDIVNYHHSLMGEEFYRYKAGSYLVSSLKD